MNLSNNQDKVHFNNLKNFSSGLPYIHTSSTTIHQKLYNNFFSLCLVEFLAKASNVRRTWWSQKADCRRLVKRFVESGLGFVFQDLEYEKYTFDQEADLDSENRLIYVKPYLVNYHSPCQKDVEERIISWEFGRPYLISQCDDGYWLSKSGQEYI